MTPFERETIINSSDGDQFVRILTHQRKFLTRLRKDPRFVEVRSGVDEGTEWAEFTVGAELWSPVSGIKKRGHSLTPQQRADATARLAQARALRSETHTLSVSSGSNHG